VVGLAAVVVLAGVSACGSTTIDNKKAADAIVSNGLVKNAKTVTCPSGVTAKAGGTFECTATGADGSKATVTMHVQDSSGRVTANTSDVHVTPAGGGGGTP
jgi:hypothetical protein